MLDVVAEGEGDGVSAAGRDQEHEGAGKPPPRRAMPATGAFAGNGHSVDVAPVNMPLVAESTG
jgi:hypothetical protein